MYVDKFQDSNNVRHRLTISAFDFALNLDSNKNSNMTFNYWYRLKKLIKVAHVLFAMQYMNKVQTISSYVVIFFTRFFEQTFMHLIE